MTARGVLTCPSTAAANNCRNAAGLPGADYVPFDYSTHDAFSRVYPGEAEPLCRKALARNPGPRLRAELTGRLAAVRDSSGAPRQEVETLFRQALEIDLGSTTVANLYETFHRRGVTGTSVKTSQSDPHNDDDEPPLGGSLKTVRRRGRTHSSGCLQTGDTFLSTKKPPPIPAGAFVSAVVEARVELAT